MNDMVSIRKMRPFVSDALVGSAAAAGGATAALTSGDDFFLEGKKVSLAVKEFFTTGDTEEHGANQDGGHFPVFLCVSCGE